MTEVIDITKYTEKFKSYPDDFQKFADDNSVKLPGINTLKGQAISLMAQPEVRGQKYLTRPEAVKFFEQIAQKTPDAIQPFNKDFGIKRMNLGTGKYCLEYPYVADKCHIDKRIGCSISGDRNTQIDSIKNWWRTNLVDVPNDKWQLGHLDPTIDDSSEKNLAFQPPIQGKYRDRFKWDSYFLYMWPTAEKELIPKLDKYYTEKEQLALLDALKKKFPSAASQ